MQSREPQVGGIKIPPNIRKLKGKIKKPPSWKETSCCQGCKKEFTFLRRDHHCRHCGGNFCGDCANKFTQIPKYGFILSEVRTCDPCFSVVRQELELAEKEAEQENVKLLDVPPLPDWELGTHCHTCYKEWSAVDRRHHCRNCGHSFCNMCSNNFASLPKYGFITRNVRLCDACYETEHKSKPNPAAK